MTELEKKLNNIGGLLGIARKAGYVIVGQDNLVGYTKKLYLILLDETAGNSLSREMKFLSEKTDALVVRVKDLAKMINIENCKVIGIKNKNIADEIVKNIKGE